MVEGRNQRAGVRIPVSSSGDALESFFHESGIVVLNAGFMPVLELAFCFVSIQVN